MGQHTEISWTESTWSPWWGCRETSPACQNCYAKRLSHRFGRDCWGDEPRLMLSEAHWRKPLAWNRKAEREGRIIPVFPSMCDPFEDRPELVEPRGRLFGLIRKTPNLLWLLLTKRPENIKECLIAGATAFQGGSVIRPNVALGITVESPDFLWRIVEVLKVPAALHFVSAEPLLGELDLTRWLRKSVSMIDYAQRVGYDAPHGAADRLGWVIAGGESGPKARPSHPNHFRSLRDQCQAAGVPFFFKQHGEFLHESQFGGDGDKPTEGNTGKAPVNGFYRVGKKRAGRLLDGRTWSELPEVMR